MKPRSWTSRSILRGSRGSVYLRASSTHALLPVRFAKIHIMPGKNPSHQWVQAGLPWRQRPFSVYIG